MNDTKLPSHCEEISGLRGPRLSFAGRSLAPRGGQTRSAAGLQKAALAGFVYVWVLVSYITMQVGHVFLQLQGS